MIWKKQLRDLTHKSRWITSTLLINPTDDKRKPSLIFWTKWIPPIKRLRGIPLNKLTLVQHRTTISKYIPTYMPTYLPTYIPTHIPTDYLLPYILTYFPTYLPTHLPTYLPTYLLYILTYFPTYIPTHLPTYIGTTWYNHHWKHWILEKHIIPVQNQTKKPIRMAQARPLGSGSLRASC